MTIEADYVVDLELTYRDPEGVLHVDEPDTRVVVTAGGPTEAASRAILIASEVLTVFNHHFDERDDIDMAELRKGGTMKPHSVKVTVGPRILDSDDFGNGVLQADHDWRGMEVRRDTLGA